jgi:hypothetical protein
MGPAIAVLAALALAVLWAFFNFPPEAADEKPLSVFNWSVVGAGALICLTFVLKIKANYTSEELAKYRGPLEIAGALGIEVLWLGLMFLLRNFWIFKPKRPGRSPW